MINDEYNNERCAIINFEYMTSEGEYLRFDCSIYLAIGQNQYLFSRGFIDKSLYLSSDAVPQCEFKLQQKNYMAKEERKTNKGQLVVFGTSVLLKHVYSSSYVCIEVKEDKTQILSLTAIPTQNSYFQILPQRTFEHKGDYVSLNSTFIIKHSNHRGFLGSNVLQDEPVRLKMQQQLKNNKIIQSHKMIQNDHDNGNNSFCVENEHSLIRQTWEKREELNQQIRKKLSNKTIVRHNTLLLDDDQSNQNQKEETHLLPLYNGSSKERCKLKHCLIEKHIHTMWRVEMKESGKHLFLQDNDYIYFISSNKTKGLLNVSSKNNQIQFIKNPGDNQYVCSAVFIVETSKKDAESQEKQDIYLRHLLTGKYFPFNQENIKKRLRLAPLLPISVTQKKLPPFHLYFQGQFYPKQMQVEKHVCGFWLNKVNKYQINQILSLEGTSHTKWVPYLIEYLNHNRKRRQQILQQFRFSNFILEQMIPRQQENELTFRLLFCMVNLNPSIRKEVAESIIQILKNKKEYVIDILSELLDNEDNLAEKYIHPHQLQYIVKQFIREDEYSVIYMRVFRLFCGHYSQPCQRNQNVIFNLFFANQQGEQKLSRHMTQSILQIDRNKLQQKFKPYIKINKTQVTFQCEGESLKVSDLSKQKMAYIRQYFYLLGDCIKLNKHNIQLFKQLFSQCYSLQNLLLILQTEELKELKGPMTCLINAAYLQPQYRYKLYVFIVDYETMCYNGSLVALHQSPNIERLINYIMQQIEEIRCINTKIDKIRQLLHRQPSGSHLELEQELESLNNQIKEQYKSTKFKHLLDMIKFTIENSYWNSIDNLLIIVDTLARLYKNKKDIGLKEQTNYQQINQWKNYMDSTILSIKIAILLLDIHINTCLSSLLAQSELSDNKVDQEINNFIRKIQSNKQLKFDFNCFQLCDTDNPQLIKKSLMLSQRFYQIRSIIYQKYNEAKRQKKSAKNMKDQIQLIKDTIDKLKLPGHESIEVCQKYICSCTQRLKIEDILPLQLQVNGYILTSIYRYKVMVPQFQFLACKLGVLDIIEADLTRYINLRAKQKAADAQSIYWKMMLLYVLVKGNDQIRKMISGWRMWLLGLLNQKHNMCLLVVDILEQIYRDNRKIIVADVQEIKIVCGLLTKFIMHDNGHELCSSRPLNVRINRLLNLVNAFLLVGSKKVKNNYQAITNELFDKQNIIQYILKLKNIQNYNAAKIYQEQDVNSLNNNHLFQILLYELTQTLQQKPDRVGFSLPSLSHMTDLIFAIGRKNWLLTLRIYNIITDKHMGKYEEEHTLIKVLRSHLNAICEQVFAYKQQHSDEFKQSNTNFPNNHELSSVFPCFPILIKAAKILILSKTQDRTDKKRQKTLQPQSPMKLGNGLKNQRKYLIQRLFLFQPYLSKGSCSNIADIAESRSQYLGLDSSRMKILKQFSLTDFSLQQIKQQRCLVDLAQASKPKSILSPKLEMRVSRSRSMRIETQGLINWVKFVTENSIHKNSPLFSINEAKQFIKSLIYINKSQAKVLDTDLKSFFVSFLISTFPPQDQQDYSNKLAKHQKTLIDFGTAQLISIILQQKFRQSYELFTNVFELGNKLLQSGNQQSQEQFLKIFKVDHKNIIFQNINSIIQNSLMGVRFYYFYGCSDGNHGEPASASWGREVQTLRQKRQVCELLKRIFRFLQLLCQNDNQNLKKYVFSQTNENGMVKYMSINFIEIAINLLIQFVDIVAYNLKEKQHEQDEIRLNLVDVIFYILDFLIQVCQYPAIKNQVYICNTDFFNVINKLGQLRKNFKFELQQELKLFGENYEPRGGNYQSEKQISQIKKNHKSIFMIERKIILLLRGLLQQRNSQIIQTISKKLQADTLKSLIESSLSSIDVQNKSQLQEYLNTKNDRLIEQIENVVDILIVSKVLGFGLQKHFTGEKHDIMVQIDTKIRQIQVDFKGQLTKIYFCYRPIFDCLSESTRTFFINKSSMHESRNQKLRDLISSRHIINQDILNRKQRQLIISEKGISHMFTFAIFLCFILIGLQLFFYTVNKMGIALDQLQTNIIHGMALMQFIISGLYFILWGINISPITRQKLKSKHKIYDSALITKWQNRYHYYYIFIKQIYIEESTSLHALLLLMLSFFSCFFQLRLYSLVLLYIFAKIQLLSSILTAIRLTWGKLLIVCLLATAFSFIFGLLSINNYIRVLYQNQSIDIDIEHITAHCTTILSCIDSLYTQRIIGETPSREGDSSHYGRFFSDVIYWAFFDILLTNIIAAIIIDKFAELRNKKQKIQNQKRNRCFICYADKSSIQRKNQDFEQHVQYKHSVWDYFYYLYYLQKLKSHTQYTGIQYWIVRQVKANMIDWFPIDELLKDDYGEKKMTAMFQLFKNKLEQEQKQE